MPVDSNDGAEIYSIATKKDQAKLIFDKIDGVANLLTAYSAMYIHYDEFSNLAK